MEAGDKQDSKPIRVILADDHAVVRQGIRRVLDEDGGFEIVAEAGDLDSVHRYVRGHHPDVLVLDLNMPGGPVIRDIPKLREEAPETEIVVLTMESEPIYAREALSNGARGYVLKDAAEDELVTAIREAATGESYLNPRLAARVAAAPPPGPPGGLSEREAEVLRLVALGFTNVEIASQLFLSIRTVETHRSHIQQKLRLRTRSDLVQYALDHGLVEAKGTSGS